MAVGEEDKRRMETSQMRFLTSAIFVTLREMTLRVRRYTTTGSKE
jgi:hypothetical protein